MGSILIIGNVIKDIYLKLDERHNVFETDEEGTPWMNLEFNATSHPYYRRTSVYGGAAVTFEVLSRFGLEADIVGEKLVCDKGEIRESLGREASGYRYILCNEDKITYFVPSERVPTKWSAPTEPIDWLFIDRSATITPDLARHINAFMSISKTTRLAIYLTKGADKIAQDLALNASVIFSEKSLPEKYQQKEVCLISPETLSLGDEAVSWNLEKADMSTHLTVYSIAAASILGALIRGESAKIALLMAKINADQSSLTQSLDVEKLKQMAEIEKYQAKDLAMMAKSLVGTGKGILAADESGGSIHKKFEAAGIPDDEKHRRDYRNLLLTTAGLKDYVNGVILFDETARQRADNGQSFVTFLTNQGIIPGIKVDEGLAKLPNSTEQYTKGLDGLRERLHEYYEMGLRFAKWRAAFEITDMTPTKNAVARNCEILAKYAWTCQQEQLVPIVEPEVVYDGDYSLQHCALVTGRILDALFEALKAKHVRLEACVLKCNMVLAGKQFATPSTAGEVGRATAEVLRQHVPAELAGVVFLSGGQSPEQATENLQAVTNNGPFPWSVTFSFARALQDPALEAWMGQVENVENAQKAFRGRLEKNVEALIKRQN